ncbi:sodium-independent sulfate anion transporter isoform X1 [Onthophagus taurus]|uniref:sodium-independent sulfate anion transporter isoform X1 n=2 Tax=Onthophagus taurus TaxID=166361 RepID=UPI0039BEA639
MKGDKDALKLSNENMSQSESDVQGIGGGGKKDDGNHAYTNPALSSSSDSINDNYGNLNKGSEAFIVVDESKEQQKLLDKVGPWVKTKAEKAFTKKTLYKRVPILSWLPNYNMEWAIGDFVAGITVGLTVIPQALAYSNIAGLPAQYGLYGSFLGCFVYIIFGSCKDIPIGPTAIASLLTYQAVNGMGPEHAILLAFLAGVIELAMGLLGLGFLIDFVSGPVSSGFTSAVALIIFSSQVKDILGIKVIGNTFLEIWISIFDDIHNTTLWDPIMGVSCIVVLLFMRKLAFVQVGPKPPIQDEKATTITEEPTTLQKVINKTIWLISTARNAILVVICGFIGLAVYNEGQTPPFKLIGDVPQGLPDIKPPPFGFTRGNETFTFGEMVSNLGSGVIVIPLIALLENIAICKAFADGKAVDATQELISTGLCNIANCFFQAYPVNGALSRGAVNNCSGVRTPMGGLYTGLLVIFALLFFTPYFFYIPKAALAGIIIAAVIFMVEVKVVKPMWRTKKSDLLPGMATFIACLLLPLEYGILIGVGLNLVFILYHAARPKILVERSTSRNGIDYLMLTPDRCLIFPSVDYVRRLVTKHSIRQGVPVVIDCSHIYGADFTAAQVVETLTKDFAARDQPLYFYNLKPSVCAVFEGLSPKEFVVVYDQDQLENLLKEKNTFKPKDIFGA